MVHGPSIRTLRLLVTFAVLLLPALLLPGCRSREDDPSAAGERTPQALAATLDAAETYYHQGDLAEAEVILVRLLDVVPDDIGAHEMLSEVLSLRANLAEGGGELDRAHALRGEASDHADRVTDLDPGSAGRQMNAGVLSMVAGRTGAAEEHFLAVERLDPAHALAPLHRAQILMQRGELDAAAAAAGRCLANDPDEVYAHATLAMVALEQGAYDQARTCIGRARQRAPLDLALQLQEGIIHRRSGSPERTIELLSSIPEEDRHFYGITLELARAWMAIGDGAKAESFFREHAEARPGDAALPDTAVELAEMAILDGRPDVVLWIDRAEIMGASDADLRRLRESRAGED